MTLPLAQELAAIRALLQGPLAGLDMERLGAHNRSYARGYAAQRFERFVQDEWPYYARVLSWYRDHVPRGTRVLEIGTFIPVMALLLKRDGYAVSTVEKLSLYGDALHPMIEVLRQQGVDFIDADIMDPGFDPGRFGAVNLLAVVEHLLGSPKELLLRIRTMLEPGGAFVFAVPNQARFVRRLGLMFGGISVHPPFEDYFESSYPFSGHHREYTASEVRFALTRAGFRIEHLGSVRYPPTGSLGRRAITAVGNLLPMTFHQMLFAVGR